MRDLQHSRREANGRESRLGIPHQIEKLGSVSERGHELAVGVEERLPCLLGRSMGPRGG